MGKIALREVRFHPVRFLMSILAVMLGVAFVAGTFCLREMMSETFDDIIATSQSGDAYVRGAQETDAAAVAGLDGSTGRNAIPLSLRQTLADVDGVASLYPDLSGPIVLVGKDGTAVSSGGAPAMGMGFDAGTPGVELIAGRMATGAGEIVLEKATMAKSGLRVGQHTTVVLGEEPHPVTVVGEVNLDSEFAGAVLVILDEATATQAYAPNGTVPSFTVFADDGVSQSALASQLSAALPAQANAQAVTGDTVRADTRKSIDEELGFVGTFLLVFAAIALFVGAFIIANTFTMLIKRRQRELAMLRAVGASPGQVFGSTLAQSTVIGVIGSVLGVGVGLGLVAGLRAVFASVGMELSGKIPLDVQTVGISLAVGTSMAIIAALVPARRAAMIKPIEAMQEASGAPEKPLTIRAILGALVVGVGIALTATAARSGTEGMGTLGLAAIALVIGVLIVSPAICRAVVSVLAAPFVWAIKPLGKMARGNATRSPRRTASTAGALMVGMALVGAVAVLASSMQTSMKSIVDSELRADYQVTNSGIGMVPAGAVAAIEKISGTTQHVLLVGSATANGEQADIASADPATFTEALSIIPVEGSWQNFEAGQAVVSKAYAEQADLKMGDTLTLATEAGERRAKIGVIQESLLMGSITVPPDIYNALVPAAERQVVNVLVNIKPGVSTAAVRSQLVDAVKPYYVLSVQDSEDMKNSLADQVNQMLAVLYALLGLSIIIAVLGIVNTLALSIMDRTREIGLTRAVGLGRFQLGTTISIESILIALFGTVAGLAVGVGLAAQMPGVLADQGLSDLTIPWSQLVTMVVIAIVVGLVASLWPANRAARLPVLEAISYE